MYELNLKDAYMKIDWRKTGQRILVKGSMAFLSILLFSVLVCCESEEDYPNYNPPADHTVSKDGVMHRSGLTDPTQNCTTCHGNDLTGGTAQVSCYECHGQEW